MKCFYCNEPLSFADLEIDHIVPKWLLNQRHKLQEIVRDYKLTEIFPGFSIESEHNWVPAHGGGCNGRKGSDLLPKRLTQLYLAEVNRRLPRVESTLVLLRKIRKKDSIFSDLAAAIERRDVSTEEIYEFLEAKVRNKEPLVITIGINLEEVFEQDLLTNEAPLDVPALYDWLEADLENQLRAAISTPFHRTECSERDGECISVRFAFPDLKPEEMPRVLAPCWEILEAEYFSDIYRITYESYESHESYESFKTTSPAGQILEK